MSLVERIQHLSKEKKITIAELERKNGISNGQIRKWDNSTPGIDKLEVIADFFDVSTDYLLGRTDKKRYNVLTEKDEKDIAKRMDKMKKDLIEGRAEGQALLHKGEPMSEEAMESLLEALEMAERITTLANKKYVPNKYKDKE